MAATHTFILVLTLLFQSLAYACGDDKHDAATEMTCAPKLALAASHDASLEIVKNILSKYRTAKAVSIDVDKKVVFALLDDEKKSSGRLILSGGRMRLEIAKPDPSVIVVNDKVIWVETPASVELNSKTQVLKIRSKELNKQAKAPLAMLLGKNKIWEEFKVKNQKSEAGSLRLDLEPKDKAEFAEVTLLTIQVDEKKQLIQLFSYSDELGNQTQFNFSNANFEAKFSEADLAYSPPANAEVTEY